MHLGTPGSIRRLESTNESCNWFNERSAVSRRILHLLRLTALHTLRLGCGPSGSNSTAQCNG